LFPGYVWTDSLWTGRTDLIEMRWFALYALILAALVVGAGACTLLPRTRRLIGRGLLLGIVTASTWGLLYLPSNRIHLSGTPFDGGWWFELVAHLILVAAACLAGLVLVRTAHVHLTRPRPQSQLPWLVALLGGVGALALYFTQRRQRRRRTRANRGTGRARASPRQVGRSWGQPLRPACLSPTPATAQRLKGSDDRHLVVAGELAIVGAALLVVGPWPNPGRL
jgi:hypothetical protein